MSLPPRFVHLRLHSEYSITDGIARIDAIINRAAADGMGALALTDLANVFGMIKFYSAARAAGIKPVIGCDVWVRGESDARDSRDTRDAREGARLLLLVKNRQGYLRLCELLAAAYLAPRRQGRAEIDDGAFDTGDNSGLIALSGAQLGEVGQLLAADKTAAAKARASLWARRFPGAYYLELQRPQGKGEGEAAPTHQRQEQLIAATLELARACQLPVVATHPIQFVDADDFLAHEARVCIAEGYVLADARRPKNFTPAQCFKTQDEMARLFSDCPEALENSVEIARRCSLALELGKSRLPDFPTPPGVALNDYLAQQARAGLEKRLIHLYPDAAVRDAERARYGERLDFEIATICKMGFAGYFLIVADFIGWAKNHGVPVGPGRGSGAGSLVSYALSITDLDPLHYELLFERFLNPERVSMPDFDIDFCQEGRDRVIQYVKEKYGAHTVAQIATFGTMAAKAVIRDVGRVLDMPFTQVDQFAKLIPFEVGMTLEKAQAVEPAIIERVESDESMKSLWELALKLEGLTRNVGMHAGGVLIAPGRLTDFCPLYSADGGATTVSQFDKDDVEKVGLVKFDFLGLRTLTILDEATRLARSVEGADIHLDALPLDDAQVFEKIFKNANTTAVFQFESAGMKDMLVQARPDRLEDLIALNALYRPGPMDLIPTFIARKHGRETVHYPHPAMEKVLATTYGVMVYQEQVMQTAQVIAGYSLGDADLLRRAMGKKKPEEMEEQRAIFVRGAQTNGISEKLGNEIFDTMEKFAGYGFNKSHAAAYSLVAYHTAWLKLHHPAAFYAATLSSEMANTDKLQFFFSDAKNSGLEFLPPAVNESGIRFQPVDAKTIRYGLGAIKGTGEAALGAILKARAEGGPFTDLFDFCARVDKGRVNRRVIEALVRAGAFDALDRHRAKLFNSVGIALEAAEQAERNRHQCGLFDTGAETAASAGANYVETRPWPERERLTHEKQALGFFLSGHPFTAYREELAQFVKRDLSHLEPQKEPVLLAGMVLATRTQMTRRGKMGVITLDDGAAQVELTVFNELWEAERDKIKEDELLLVEGRVQKDDYTGGLRVTADKLYTLSEARTRHARVMRLTLNGGAHTATLQRLQELMAPYRGGACPVRISYKNADAATEIALPDTWRLRLDDALLDALNDCLKAENVRVVYAQ